MLIAMTSDTHYDLRNRWGECLCIQDWIADDFDRRGVDLVLHGGDMFERKSEPAEHNEAIKWLQRVAQRRAVLGVKGNHCYPADVAKFNEIRAKFPVIFEETAAVHVVNGVAVACVAWPKKAELLARIGDSSKQVTEQMAQEHLRNILRGLGQQLAQHTGPKILLGHFQICGALVDEDQPLVGADMEESLPDLALVGAGINLCGHIHMHQRLGPYNDVDTLYPGAPYGRNFGEAKYPKGYLLIELPSYKWEFVQTPYTPLVLLTNEWVGEWKRPINADVKKSDVRFRFSFDSDHRVAAELAAKEVEQRLLSEGAVRVKLDGVEKAKITARAPEMAEAKTTQEKLDGLWRLRGETIPPLRRTAIFNKVNDLEVEVLHG